MAKVESNPIVRGISGKIGNLVFRPMPNGETYVSSVPNFDKRKFSKGQKDHQGRFKLAVAYAREASKTQPIYAKLAEGTVMSAYNFALSDWFNPPVIHTVERKDGRVRVQASDNVMVVKVVVTVLDEEGKVVEKKDAVQTEKDWWEVDLAGDGKIVVEARDLAGNVGRGELTENK
jgi:hypothetical protein